MMESIYFKILAIVLIFVGEALAIYAELLVAKNNFMLGAFMKMFLMIAVGGLFLLLGYYMGFNNFKNIWIVTVASVTSILILEPVLTWYVFEQTPTRGALIGLILGALGLIFALFD